MNIEKVIILSIFFCLLLLYGCPAVCHFQFGALTIKNNTDSTIYVYDTCLDSITLHKRLRARGGLFCDNCQDANGYPITDTLVLHYKIKPYGTDSLRGYGEPNHRQLNCSTKTLRLFFISESTMLSKTWEEICREQLYERKMKFTEHELDSLNWKVVYE